MQTVERKLPTQHWGPLSNDRGVAGQSVTFLHADKERFIPWTLVSRPRHITRRAPLPKPGEGLGVSGADTFTAPRRNRDMSAVKGHRGADTDRERRVRDEIRSGQ